MTNKLRLTALLMTLTLFCALASSCGASNDKAAYPAETSASSYAYSDGEYADYGYSSGDYDNSSDKMEMSAGDFSSGGTVSDTRKIVRSMDLSLETKDFDAGIEKINSITEACGGYVESSYISGRSYDYYDSARNASYTLRIPAASLDKFVGELCADGEGFNVLSKSEDASDITDAYYDTQSRLDSLKTQEERLLSMLEGATELEYMLQIEDKLADVRYQIENYYSTITRYDKSVAMSTVSINLSEVIEYQTPVVVPKTFGEKLMTAFTDSWSDFADGCKSFAVDFVYAIPTLLVLAVIIFVAVLIIKAFIRKSRRSRIKASETDGDSSKPVNNPYKASENAQNSTDGEKKDDK